jgi:hypothetical protein
VAYASTANKYLVVWHEVWHPTPLNHSISGRLLTSAGELEGSDFYISQDPGDGSYRREPDVAYNRSRNEYLVVWEQRDPGPGDYDIYGRRVQGFGTPMHPESIEIRRGGADQLFPAVAAVPTEPNQGRYLVAWEDHWIPTDTDIHGRRLTGEGEPQDPPYKIIANSNEDETRPAVGGSEGAWKFLITWTRHVQDPQAPWVSWDLIFGREVGQGGAFLTGGIDTGGVYDADHSAVAAGPGGGFVVVFDEDPSMGGNRDIFGRLWGARVYAPLVIKRHR